MPDKPTVRRFILNPRPHNTVLNRHNAPERDLWLDARSFHAAAKKLAGALEHGSGPFSEFNACPVVFIYRHAVELHLKAIVLGEGGNFLATKPDPLTIHKTHSVVWLGQFIAQIVTALKWESEFKCQGVENLDDFKAVIEELNAVDPGSYAFRLPGETEAKGAFDVRAFATRMDALLALLDSTADALAAEWDLRSGAVPERDRPGCRWVRADDSVNIDGDTG